MAKLPITYKGKPIAATGKKKKGADGGSRKWLWLLLLLLIAAGVGYAVYRFSRGNEDGVISRTTETVRQLAAGKNGQDGSETARLPVSVPLDQDGRSGIALRALANGEKLYAQKHYAGARDQARIAMGKFSYTDPKWQESADLLNRCSTRILNGDGSSRETFVYTVQRGDSYSRIGAKFGTTAEAVQRINKVSPSQTVLRIGQELIVYNGKWSIKISQSALAAAVMTAA